MKRIFVYPWSGRNIFCQSWLGNSNLPKGLTSRGACPLALALTVTTSAAAQIEKRPSDYEGWKIVEVSVSSRTELDTLLAMEDGSQFQIWTDRPDIGEVTVRLAPGRETGLDTAGLSYRVTIENLALHFDQLHVAAQSGEPCAYETYDKVVERMVSLASKSSITEMMSIGTSVRGQPLWTFRITGAGADKPGVLYHGAQHGNEFGGTATIMRLADYLVSNYGVLPEVTKLLDSVEFYLLPIMNPDSYPYDRYNEHSVDLNRNWDGPTGQTNSGPWPFSEPETAAIRDFFSENTNVRAHVDLHTSGWHIMWPWGYTKEYCLDHNTFATLGARMQESILAAGGPEYITGPVYTAIYPVLGGSIDFSYGFEHIWAFIFELGGDCNEALPALLDLANWIGDCNSNGVPDVDDIGAGESADCNVNSVADECEYQGDCNGDGSLDICELYVAGDCNSNGMPDSCDIDVGGVDDCNANSVPDECEADCNANSTADECDILVGSSADCDGNGAPDECQSDCDRNGAADACEIAAGSPDCNENGIPDSCEDCDGNGFADSCDLAAGRAHDRDGNGVLDICETIWFVDDDAYPSGDGQTWATAFDDLQDALAAAEPGDTIRVAGGIYTPAFGIADRHATFQLVSGVQVLGGYAGIRDVEPDRRDWKSFESCLSGDLNRDDPGTPGYSDCCVVHNYGGCSNATCQSDVCRYQPACCTWGWGEECVSMAQRNTACRPVCRSTAENSLHVLTSSGVDRNTIIDGFTITGGNMNEEYGTGGGIYNDDGNPVFRNCTVVDNFAYWAGGGAWSSGECVFENCSFSRNRTFQHGSAVYNNGTANFNNCLFINNGGENYGGAVVNDESVAVLDHCVLEGNTSRDSAVTNWASNVSIKDCHFLNNAALFHLSLGGALTNSYGGNVKVIDSLFVGNSADDDGGAVYNDHYTSNVVFTGCTFASNYAARNGGAMLNQESTPQISNCIFSGNTDENGDGETSQIYFDYYSGIYTPHIHSSFIQGWSGAWGGIGNSGADPLFVDGLGPDGIEGTGDENFRLSANSPAIDAGVITDNTPEIDLDGHARVLCGAVDPGPYEFGIGDYDCDRAITAADFPPWTWCMQGPAFTPDPLPGGEGDGCEALDFDGDNRVDLSDFAAFQRAIEKH